MRISLRFLLFRLFRPKLAYAVTMGLFLVSLFISTKRGDLAIFLIVVAYVMKPIGTMKSKLFPLLSSVLSGSALIALALAGVGTYAIVDSNAHSTGITGQTQKTTSAGCSCH